MTHMAPSFIDSLAVSTRIHIKSSWPSFRRYRQQHSNNVVHSAFYRRARVSACISQNPDASNSPPQAINGYVTEEFDFNTDIVSDDTHVVIDSSDINDLIQRLQSSGEDDLIGDAYKFDDDSPVDGVKPLKNASVEPAADAADDDEALDPLGFDSKFFNAAERLSDAKQGRPSKMGRQLNNNIQTTTIDTQTSECHSSFSMNSSVNSATHSLFNSSPTNSPPSPSETDAPEKKKLEETYPETSRVRYGDAEFKPMEYFTMENAEYMPSWIRTMYENNEHGKLQAGSHQFSHRDGQRRLHDIVEGKSKFGEDTGNSVPDTQGGIADCTIGEVAEDYNIPVEFIVDALVSFGVQTPLKRSQGIRDTCTSDEIRRLLFILARHDSTTLAERYSDRSIAEVAEDYDLQPEQIIAVCEKEGLYIHAGIDTHMSVVREDRVLEIIINDEPLGKPYPPLLDGLE